MSNNDIEVARTFHELTMHSYTSVRSGGYRLDWDNRPLPYKIYPQAGALNLPRDLTLSDRPALEVLMGPQTNASKALDVPALTRILFCAGGLTRRKRVGTEDYHFRAAASAGALYPIEIYVAAAGVDGLESGLYHFSPADLKLRGLRRGDWRSLLANACAPRPEIAAARAVLILTAIFWRSAWKYRARAYRYCFWDAGTILANLIAAAHSEGIDTATITTFEDQQIEQLLEVDGEREGIACMVPLGRTTAPQSTPPELLPLGLDTIALSPHETVYNELVMLHRESRLNAREVAALNSARIEIPTCPARPGLAPAPLATDSGLTLGETVLRRGSTRIFARQPIGAEELATILTASAAPLPTDFPRLSDIYVIANAVEGMEPGAYYFDSGNFELLKPGSFRKEAGYLCLEQALGADCSALICYMADLERVLAAMGNRGYRNVHMEAGLRGGRAYLAGYALRRGASGLTFYDEDASTFFAPHAAGKSPLLMVAIGVPWKRGDGTESL